MSSGSRKGRATVARSDVPSAEEARLDSAPHAGHPWKKWGPYLSERQWGTVREDYSANGDAWNYFTHDQARSRAYKWGEDGIAGISDDRQQLCWALALWNGKDPIIKERLFGLANSEGNHGEDVKEYYYYLDSTPTHSYMKYLYKYPQAAYPYDEIVRTNAQRSRAEAEYELLDTGVFADGRYFDVFVEFAKASPDDLLIRIAVANRGPEAADLHLLPQLWFRNTWWRGLAAGEAMPLLRALPASAAAPGVQVIEASHPALGVCYLYAEGAPTLLFTDNETNQQRVFGTVNTTPYVKDAINDYLVAGRADAVNPAQQGSKAAVQYVLRVSAGETVGVRLRLTKQGPGGASALFGAAFDAIFSERLAEADAFYADLTPPNASADEAMVMRQALAGMLWSKQYYLFDLDCWLDEHDANPISGGKRSVRNRDWYHMVNEHIISMPDKWEYPWYAAWDLAFHTIPLSMVDVDFAQDQLRLMLRDSYIHPNGQIPAYEWNFGDVNPPVHAFATLFNFVMDRSRGETDQRFIKNAFSRLLLNFSWWVNRKDPRGRNAFNGGFLGLDNIGVFDRSSPLPTGGVLEQADGTAWMVFFTQNMLELAIAIAEEDDDYEDFILKFVQHFYWIGGGMDRVGDQQDELWDEDDGFFYDVLLLPDGSATRIKVRSMVGLLPLAAVTVIPESTLTRFPAVAAEVGAFVRRHPELSANIHPFDKPGVAGRRLLSVLNETKLRRVLARMLDEERFLGDYGIRALSKWHQKHPYTVTVGGVEYKVEYLPGESDNGMFGGNSNWRGPIWMPVNLLLVRALLQYYAYYGDDFRIEMPTGSGRMATLFEVAKEIADRLIRIFTLDANGRRPVFGDVEMFRSDPHWRDHLLFYEYFHGDSGAGLGASHQTGWTGVVARLIHQFRTLTPEDILHPGRGHQSEVQVDAAAAAQV